MGMGRGKSGGLKIELNIEILKLCLLYTRCRACGRLKPSLGREYIKYCPLCKSRPLHIKDSYRELMKEFEIWVNSERYRVLDRLLPNPIPPKWKIKEMIREAKRSVASYVD